MSRRAALFDMDKTLVRVNTAALFVRWQFQRGETGKREMARMIWWLTQYTFGVVDAEAIATAAATGLRGRSEADFRAQLREFVQRDVLRHIAERARSEVRARQESGHLCAVLTSSTSYSADPLAEMVGIDHVLCSRLEVLDGRFTGAFEKPLCYGSGKVAAAEIWARAHDVDLSESAFYTDSISDLPMLERVGERIVVNPDPRLRWLAWRRGWRSERW